MGVDYSLALNVPIAKLETILTRLDKGPVIKEAYNIKNWKIKIYREFGYGSEQEILMDDFMEHIREAVEYKYVTEDDRYEGRSDIHIYINYVDIRTNTEHRLRISFCGCYQKYWNSELAWATFEFHDPSGTSWNISHLREPYCDITQFLIEAMEVEFGYGDAGSHNRSVEQMVSKGDPALTIVVPTFNIATPLITGPILTSYFGLYTLRSLKSYFKLELLDSTFIIASPYNFYPRGRVRPSDETKSRSKKGFLSKTSQQLQRVKLKDQNAYDIAEESHWHSIKTTLKLEIEIEELMQHYESR